jgi:crossover junction endodeoxyribonuclease RuvC
MSQGPAPTKCVLGIDPGLNTTGYGVLAFGAKGPILREAGVIRGGTAKRNIEERLFDIHEGLRDVLTTFRPIAMAIEQLYSHYERPRTAILMGHARGVICLAAQECDTPVVHYASTHVKKILTGSGHAPKDQIQRAIQLELNLKAPPEPPDVADALAIALCHYYAMKRTSWT